MRTTTRRTLVSLTALATVGVTALGGGSASATPSAQDTAYIEFAARANLAEVALASSPRSRRTAQPCGRSAATW